VNKKVLAAGLAGFWAIQAQQIVSFPKDVLPVLTNNCLKCHGEALQLSGLDLRSRAAMLKGGQKGPAVVPGNAEQSRLYRLVAGLEKPSMPMDGKLSEAQAATLRDWINQGALWEGEQVAKAAPTVAPSKSLEDMEIPAEARKWWSFQKPVRHPVPRVKNAAWGRHPIDAFLTKVFEEKSMIPAPPADKNTLVRRAYLDLLGLIPTPEQVAAFVNDNSPHAWEKLIERLLASPHYGERWGRYWLDVVRYADSAGFEHDRDRPTAWRYRDYVIDAFNKDTPYNVFVKEQLAGDELDWVTFESKTATGFYRVGPRVEFREKDNPQYRFDYLDDFIATTAQGFLGLTVQCARCHNHKFDPIPQKDYYRMQAAFFPYVDVNHYLAPDAEAEAFQKKMDEIDARIQPLRQAVVDLELEWKEKAFVAEVASRFPEDAQIAVRTPADQRTPGQTLLANQLIRAVGVPAGALERHMPPEIKTQRAELLKQIRELEAQRPRMPSYAIGVTDGDYRFSPDGPGDEQAPGKGMKRDGSLQGSYLPRGPGPYTPPPSYFLIRGDMDSKGSLMEPGFVTVATYGNPPTAIPPADGRTSGRRRALAEWIASPDNPLTARVMVNRIWHHHFGRGLVRTLNNFGKLGDPPTHPELLDWLATEFVGRGWSIKQMHRLMMTSNAYRMASAYENAVNLKADPENKLLWRFRMQRMDAEALRDNVLYASGKLNRERGGPPVFPKVDASVLATMRNGIWQVEEDGPKVWRRAVYVYRKRGMPFPMFEVFDLPDQSVSCSGRNVSTVPTQALTLLNNEFVLKQARFFAERVAAEAGADPSEQVTRAYQIATARNPSDEEKRLGMEFIGRQRQFHAGRTAETAPAENPVPGVTEPNLAALADFTHVLLNLNEFVYMR
jgi:hypothetical protein